VVEYLGFTPQNLSESPPDSLNPKYSTTVLQGNRDRLEELPIADIPTLDTEPSPPLFSLEQIILVIIYADVRLFRDKHKVLH
jgi:hypothetical protein